MLKAADAEYRELFQTLGASRAQEFRKLRIPYCLPYLFSALKISSSLAVVGAIVLAGNSHSRMAQILGTIAIVAATSNIVGGFIITDRMLKMFKLSRSQK